MRNEFKGTPAPWQANGVNGIHIKGKSTCVALTYNNEHGMTSDEDKRQADALLISQAPELLECLDEFCTLYYKGFTKKEFDSLRIKAEGIINKALNHANWKDREKSNHCFEGLVKVVEETDPVNGDTRLIYVDMYWRSGGNKWWTEKEAAEQLNMQYYCNLDDFDLSVNIGKRHEDYEETDFIYLHDQHACCDSVRYWYARKGATKSTTRMVQALEKKIEKHQRDINYAQSAIEWAEKDIAKIKETVLTLTPCS